MPKIKTHKATVKRFTITKQGKVKGRKSGKGHFNARENGSTVRQKRLDINLDKDLHKTIKTLMPY